MRTVSGPTSQVVVAGAGLAGLAAALHLAGRGREVTVIERDATPGGRAGRMDLAGFRMDTGPTVLTMPDLVAETLGAVGENLTDRLDLIRLDPAYRAQFADGSGLDVHTDAAAMTAAVAAFAGPAEADGYRRLRAWLTELYQREFGQFIAANFDSPFALATPDLGRLAALGAFRRLEPAIGRFIRDERLRRVFSFQSLYAGESPRHALAVYAVIAYMDTVAGVYFPRGGMRALPDALAGAPYSFGRLSVLSAPGEVDVADDDDDRFVVAVTFRVAPGLGVPVRAEFSCPEPRTVVMRITDGEGAGSVVETHATPRGRGTGGRPRTAVIEAVVAGSGRPGFAVARAMAPVLRPVMRRAAARLWRDDLAYAERRFQLRSM